MYIYHMYEYMYIYIHICIYIFIHVYVEAHINMHLSLLSLRINQVRRAVSHFPGSLTLHNHHNNVANVAGNHRYTTPNPSLSFHLAHCLSVLLSPPYVFLVPCPLDLSLSLFIANVYIFHRVFFMPPSNPRHDTRGVIHVHTLASTHNSWNIHTLSLSHSLSQSLAITMPKKVLQRLSHAYANTQHTTHPYCISSCVYACVCLCVYVCVSLSAAL